MKLIISIILLVGILSTTTVGAIVTETLTGRPIEWWMRRWEWSSELTFNSTLTVRGVISEILPDYVAVGFGAHYYILPAVFILNVTETIWTSDEFGVPSWKFRAQVRIAYDYKDASQFSVGQYIEARGWWEGIYDTRFSMMLVVGPRVNGSYVKAT